MKIAVEKINDKALEIKEDIPAHSWGMDSADITFKGNLHIDCIFVKVNKEIVVEASITIHRDIICSRCLSVTPQVVKQSFKRNYNIDNLGSDLDIDDDIREEILLNFPMKVLCKPDCKGICPGCGVNLNFEECKC